MINISLSNVFCIAKISSLTCILPKKLWGALPLDPAGAAPPYPKSADRALGTLRVPRSQSSPNERSVRYACLARATHPPKRLASLASSEGMSATANEGKNLFGR